MDPRAEQGSRRLESGDGERPERLAQLRSALVRVGGAVRADVQGAERVPEQGPVVLAFNHVAPLPWLALRLGQRRVHFATSRRGRTAGQHEPDVERPDGLSADREVAWRNALWLLERGELVGIFPEPDRSPDGGLYRADSLAGQLALRQVQGRPVSVLPAAVVVDSSPLSRLVQPRIRMGEPLDVERFRASADQPWAVQAVADLVLEAIQQLSGQTYRDQDARQRRQFLRAQRRSTTAEARGEAARRRAEQKAAIQLRRQDRAAEAEELAAAQQLAARAAQDHARRSAAADAARREQVRGVKLDRPAQRPARDLREPLHHTPDQRGEQVQRARDHRER